MALGRWQATIVDQSGNIQVGAQVTVRREVAGGPLAVLYSDRDGASATGNPLTADANGFVSFHAAAGAYRIDATLGAFSITWRYVPVGLGAETDGAVAGIAFTFDDGTADANPGSGAFRFNNVSPGSATQLFVSIYDRSGNNIASWLASLDDAGQSADRGIVVIKNSNDASLFVGRVTGSVTNATTYYKIPVTPISASSFSDGAIAGMTFSSSGVDGSAVSTATEATEGKLDKATDAEIRAATLGAHAICAEDLSSAAAPVALTDVSTITIGWASGINFTVTIAGNRTLGNPSSGIPGTFRTVLVSGNDATPRTLGFSSYYGGTLPTLNDITSTQKYFLTIYCKSSTQFLVTSIDGSDA